MATYTAKQIAQYAYNAGFRGAALIQATAVALAESSGVSDAVSSDGYGSHGLWQFIPRTWQSVTGTPFSNADDPQKNADAAFKLYNSNGKSFAGQWSTWPTAAASHMAEATTAAASIKGASTVTNYQSSKWKGTSSGYAKFQKDWGDGTGKGNPVLAGVVSANIPDAALQAFAKMYGFTGNATDLRAFLLDYSSHVSTPSAKSGLGSAADNLATGLGDVPSLLTGWVKDFVNAILTPALNFLIDAGMVAGGGALIFVGVFLLNREMAG